MNQLDGSVNESLIAARKIELAVAVCESAAVVFEDPRVSYVELQADRQTWMLYQDCVEGVVVPQHSWMALPSFYMEADGRRCGRCGVERTSRQIAIGAVPECVEAFGVGSGGMPKRPAGRRIGIEVGGSDDARPPERARTTQTGPSSPLGVLMIADDLLRRLAEWDHLPLTGDGPFWLREIENVRAHIEAVMPHRLTGSSSMSDRLVSWVLDRNSRYRANWLTKRIFMWGVRYFIRRGQVASAEVVESDA